MDICISVIVPTYKPKDYLWQCLDSLQDQTLDKSKFEVILVLNGCNEPWKGQIEQYISEKMKGTNVRFVQTDTPGVSNARNLGLDMAVGEYVAFIDDDDYVSPRYLELLYAKADDKTIALAYPFAFYDHSPQQQLSPKQYKITDTYNRRSIKGRQPYPRARKYFSGPCMKLINISFIQEKRFDTRYKNGEDALFMFLISNRFRFVDFADRECVYYRRYREGSAVFSQSFGQRFSNCAKLMYEYFKIFLKGRNYRLGFFITRELASIKTILTH